MDEPTILDHLLVTYGAWAVAGIILLILWAVLPFAVFGIKGYLRKILSVQLDIRAELRQANGKSDDGKISDNLFGDRASPFNKDSK